MMNLVKQTLRQTLDVNDLLLIISIALSIPLRLALPLVAQIVSMRMNIRLTFGAQDSGNSSTRPLFVPS
jgi:hypothetical protein